MVTWTSPPPTRYLSWAQLVREADPNYTRLSLQPWVYDFSNGRLFVDALPLYSFVYNGAGLYNDGGVLGLSDQTGWPQTSGTGNPGSLWSNGGVVSVNPGYVTNPVPAVIFGTLTASALLLMNGGQFPIVQPALGSGQLYIQGSEIWVA